MDSRAGVVKHFLAEKGFGFISSAMKEGDIFFHINNVAGKQMLVAGDNVFFDVGSNISFDAGSRKGHPCARNIRIQGLSGLENKWFAAVLEQSQAKLEVLAAAGQDVNAISRKQCTCFETCACFETCSWIEQEEVNICHNYKCDCWCNCDSSMPTGLLLAIQHEKVDSVRTLIDLRADVNKHALLVEAVANANERLVQMLLSAGANSNIEDDFHNTPLCVAAQNGHTSIALMLFGAGARPEARAPCVFVNDECLPAEAHAVLKHRDTALAMRRQAIQAALPQFPQALITLLSEYGCVKSLFSLYFSRWCE